MEKKYFIPHIEPTLQKFFDDHETQIVEMLEIIKKYKPHVTNSYSFSVDNPPLNKDYKYTEKLYIGCIMYVTKYQWAWGSFIGPINGSLLNARHHEYLSHHVYDIFHQNMVNIHVQKNPTKVKYLSTDTETSNNKTCTEVHKHLPYNKNRKGVKVSTIIESTGVPLVLSVGESATHDINYAIENVAELANNAILSNALSKVSGHVYFLGDSGYDGDNLNKAVKKIKAVPLIKPNNRGTKDPKKKRKFTKRQKNIYKKRTKVEHFFGIIKKYPKINCVYERTLSSFFGLVKLISAIIISKRLHKT